MHMVILLRELYSFLKTD